MTTKSRIIPAPCCRTFIASAFAALIFSGCTSDPSVDEPKVGAAIAGSSASALGAFLISRSTLSPSDVAAVASPLASVLYGASASSSVTQSISHSGTLGGSLFADVPDLPGLKVAYTASNATLLVFNAQVTRDTASLADVGPTTAHTIFAGAFDSLVAAGTIGSTGLQIGNAHLSRIIQGEGHSGNAPTERVKEYVFTVPRMLNGIEVLNSGFEASVHRSGQLARLKTFGPQIHSIVGADGSETPTGAGYTFVPSVPKAAIDTRVAAEYPQAQVKSLGLRYWLPEGTASAVVEPRQMYFVVPTATIEGHAIHGRGFYVAYSTTSASTAATIWPTPNPTAKGDRLK